MNIQIEWRKRNRNEHGFAAWIRPLLTDRLGWLALALLAILFVSESHYLNALHVDEEIMNIKGFNEMQPGDAVHHIGGVASFLGLGLMVVAVRRAHGLVRRRGGQIDPLQDPRVFYVQLTDDYLEKGVVGLCYLRYHWRVFSGYRENGSRFLLRMVGTNIAIEKVNLPGGHAPAEIREFLTEKRRQHRNQ